MMQRVRGADDINLPALMEQSLDTVDDGANWVGSGKNDSHPQIAKRVVNAIWMLRKVLHQDLCNSVLMLKLWAFA